MMTKRNRVSMVFSALHKAKTDAIAAPKRTMLSVPDGPSAPSDRVRPRMIPNDSATRTMDAMKRVSSLLPKRLRKVQERLFCVLSSRWSRG